MLLPVVIMLHIVFVYCLPVILAKAICLKIGGRIAGIHGAFWKMILIASVSMTAGWTVSLLGLVVVPMIDLILVYLLTDAARNKEPFAGALVVILTNVIMFISLPFWDNIF